jgi:hypothetical protein
MIRLLEIWKRQQSKKAKCHAFFRLIEENEGNFTNDQIKDILVKYELFSSPNKSNILKEMSRDEKVTFVDAFLLHKMKNRGGRTHSIMNRGNGSILVRSRRHSKNNPKKRRRDVSGLKGNSGERYSPHDNDKSLPRARRQSGVNCTSVMHTECLATPVKKCQLKTVEKCSAVPRIQIITNVKKTCKPVHVIML